MVVGIHSNSCPLNGDHASWARSSTLFRAAEGIWCEMDMGGLVGQAQVPEPSGTSGRDKTVEVYITILVH